MSEYKDRLETMEMAVDVTPSLHYVGIFGYESAYLDREAQKDLRRDIRDRKESGHKVVQGTNNKATWYYAVQAIDDSNYAFCKILRSYYTDVAMLFNGKLYKLWNGYSATTMSHINAFLMENGLKPIRKYDWVMMNLFNREV